MRKDSQNICDELISTVVCRVPHLSSDCFFDPCENNNGILQFIHKMQHIQTYRTHLPTTRHTCNQFCHSTRAPRHFETINPAEHGRGRPPPLSNQVPPELD